MLRPVRWPVGSPPVLQKPSQKTRDGSRFKKQDVVTHLEDHYIYNYVLYTDYLDSRFCKWFIISPIRFHGLKGKRPTWDLNELRFCCIILQSQLVLIMNIYISILAYLSIRFQTWTCPFKKQQSFYGAALPNLEVINHLVSINEDHIPPPQAYKIHRENCWQETLLYQRRKIWETPGDPRHQGHHPSWLEGLSLMLAARSSFWCLFCWRIEIC